MNCPHCNTLIPDEAAYCPNCGKAVSNPISDQTTTANFAHGNNHPINQQLPPMYNETASINYPDYQQLPPMYSDPYQNSPARNQPIPPLRNDRGQDEFFQNPYKQIPQSPPKKPKGDTAPIIIALLASIVVIGLVVISIFTPRLLGKSSNTNSLTTSKSSDYGEKAYTPTPTTTPIPTATPTIAPTSTPTPTPEAHIPSSTSESMISLPWGGQAPVSDFIFPNSSTELLSFTDLNNHLSSDYDAQMAINEIYARYGYSFLTNSETANAARSKFGNKDWYIQAQKACPASNRETFAESYMNNIERANIQNLLDWKETH